MVQINNNYQNYSINTINNTSNNEIQDNIVTKFKNGEPMLVKMYQLDQMQSADFLTYNEQDTKIRQNNYYNNQSGVALFSGSIIRQDISNTLFNKQGVILNDNVKIMHSLRNDGFVTNNKMQHVLNKQNNQYKLHAVEIGENANLYDPCRDKVRKSKGTIRQNNQAIYNATIKSQIKDKQSKIDLPYTEQLFLPTSTFKDSICGIIFESTEEFINNSNADEISSLQTLANKLNVKLYIKYTTNNNTTDLIEYTNNKLADLNRGYLYFNIQNEFD